MKKLTFILLFLTTIPYVFGQYGKIGDQDDNLLMGAYAGIDLYISASNPSGDKNLIAGPYAGFKCTSVNNSVFLGYRAAGGDGVTGNNNNIIGFQAGYTNRGTGNNMIGYQAGYANTTGEKNIFLGGRSGYENTTGKHNTFLGNQAGYSNKTGSNNVFIGNMAGYSETGSNKLYIHNGSGGNGPLIYGDFSTRELDIAGKITVDNQLSIGNGSQILTLRTNPTQNYVQLDAGGPNGHWIDAIYIGDASDDAGMQNKVVMKGKVGIGTATPDQKLSVNGNASKTGGGSWATFSDIRTKKNISSFKDGLDVLLQMNPVRFQYNGTAGYAETGKEYVGVIAQEVEKYAPYMIETVAKKLRETDKKETDLLMYDGSALAYILVNAIKEQQKLIESQQQKIEALENRIASTATEASVQERIKTLENLVATMTKKGSSDSATLHAAVNSKK